MKSSLLAILSAAFFGTIFPGIDPASARGINTFLPPVFPRPPTDRSFTVTSDKPASPDGTFIDAPQDRIVKHPPLRVTKAGKIWNVVRNLLGGSASETERLGAGGMPVMHDAVTGSPIGQFGEAYAASSPLRTR